jgi:hypothetical protein
MAPENEDVDEYLAAQLSQPQQVDISHVIQTNGLAADPGRLSQDL